MADRIEVVAFATALDGLGANPKDPERRKQYLDLIAPGETEERAAAMSLMSDCELVQRAILRAFIDHPCLSGHYQDRQAGIDLTRIAIESHALRGSVFDPSPGDIVIVGGGLDGGGSEHAWTFIGDGTGVDGGQTDAEGYQEIRIRSHTLSGGFDITRSYRRKVRAFIDVSCVLERFGR